MDRGKLEKIRYDPQPPTKKEVRSFLGLFGYYIPNLVEIAAPLTDLTKKGKPMKVI